MNIATASASATSRRGVATRSATPARSSSWPERTCCALPAAATATTTAGGGVAVEVEPGIDHVLRQMATAAPLPQLLILAAHIPLAPPPEDDIPGDGEIEQEPEPRKRDRARLTPAQREMMRVYAGRLGWSLQGHNEEELHRFCSDIGIIPQVFKVWMNNNRRKYANTGETSAAAGGRV
ncbi:hypothetical protein Acr_07g0009300 [Actinidia rufa]|uniref:Homeobox domain-containing protein n=1 Tax=Actinidia rufa TaxID=165716 RepID=A0A7J0EWE8_9ERIC|nr:hypothetical protein Acr_07g0009300 [Actinidia rufa]